MNTARTVLLYAVAAVVGILVGLATAQAAAPCTGSCTTAPPLLPVWQSGLIGFGTAAIVVIACALLDEEFVPVTGQWLRLARRRRSGATDVPTAEER